MSVLPFHVETDLERRIVSDPVWLEGAEWGEPRPGHPEGAIKHHVAEVLRNVDRYAVGPDQRRRLRVAAMTHDTFKHLVDYEKPRSGENHHGMKARRFVERFVTDDPALLDLVETHDDAFNAYSKGARNGKWPAAEERARRLIERLGPELPAYLVFFRCDDETGDKASDSFAWFVKLAGPDAAAKAGLTRGRFDLLRRLKTRLRRA